MVEGPHKKGRDAKRALAVRVFKSYFSELIVIDAIQKGKTIRRYLDTEYFIYIWKLNTIFTFEHWTLYLRSAYIASNSSWYAAYTT